MRTETAASGGIGLGRGGRLSRKRKRDAVLRLLRGEDLETLSRALLDFREIYNTSWLIDRHGFRTPTAVRQNQLPPAALAA